MFKIYCDGRDMGMTAMEQADAQTLIDELSRFDGDTYTMVAV